MLHAAAMLVGLYLLAFTLMAPVLGANSAVAAGIVSLTATMFAVRFGGASQAFTQAISEVGGTTRSIARIVRGSLMTIRTAAAADIVLKPALIRTRAFRDGAGAETRLGEKIGAAPGSIVVEIDDGGLLVHVLDEDNPGLDEFQRAPRSGVRA